MIRTEHREEKWPFSFISYEPEKRNGRLPLIIQLHGAGERGNGRDELIKVEVHGIPKFINDMNPECVFIAPQCPTDSFWAARVESILKFIELLKEEYDIDPCRVYLTGLSMGGFGTWFTAMASPDTFAAIVPVCGGGMPWNAGVLNMPIWAFHGAEDDVVKPSNSDDMVEKLIECGADVKYSRIDGVAHDVWNRAYTPELIEWMLSKKKAPKTTLLMVRHGESEANRRDIFAGHLDADLQSKGLKQAEKTAEYIAGNYNVEKVYASDLKRAYKTGKCIAEKCGVEIIADKRLREVEAGEWDGMTFNELEVKYSEDYSRWVNDLGRAYCTGGESVKELSGRIFSVLSEIAEANYGKTVVIASHATPIRAMQTIAELGDIERAGEIPWVSNASVSVFEYCDGKLKCLRASIDEHLGEIRTVLPDNV